MRILVLSNMYPSKKYPNYGVFVKNFVEKLLDENININIVCIKGRENIKIKKICKYFIFIFKSIFCILRNNYDVIYIHYAEHSVFPLALIKVFYKIKKPIIINAHGDDVLSNSRVSKIVYSTIQNASLIVVPSKYFYNIVLKKYSNPNIFISPSGGINLKIFNSKNSNLISNDNIIKLGYVSRIDHGKGWDVLLKAIHILVTKYNMINIKLTVIGCGNEEKDFLNMIDNLKINKYIYFLGVKKQNDLPEYYRNMDIFVFPSYRAGESLGLVGLEAMACGVPVIGSKIGGIETYLIDNYNGFLFEPEDYNDLALKIVKFIKLDNIQKKILIKNSINTSKMYDKEIVNKKLIHKIKNICENFYG